MPVTSPATFTFDQLLSSVTPEVAKTLGQIREKLVLSPGEVLYRQGELSRGFFVVRKGKLQLLIEGPRGTLKLALAEPGEALGLPATVNQNAYVITAMAIDAAEVEFYPVDAVQSLLHSQPGCIPQFIRLVAAAVAQTDRRKKKMQLALSMGAAAV